MNKNIFFSKTERMDSIDPTTGNVCDLTIGSLGTTRCFETALMTNRAECIRAHYTCLEKYHLTEVLKKIHAGQFDTYTALKHCVVDYHNFGYDETRLVRFTTSNRLDVAIRTLIELKIITHIQLETLALFLPETLRIALDSGVLTLTINYLRSILSGSRNVPAEHAMVVSDFIRRRPDKIVMYLWDPDGGFPVPYTKYTVKGPPKRTFKNTLRLFRERFPASQK